MAATPILNSHASQSLLHPVCVRGPGAMRDLLLRPVSPLWGRGAGEGSCDAFLPAPLPPNPPRPPHPRIKHVLSADA